MDYDKERKIKVNSATFYLFKVNNRSNRKS